MGKRSGALPSRKQIALTVKRRLALLGGGLILILLVLLLGIGEAWWPTWVAKHRTQVEGIIVLAVVVLALASPILVEASSNTRTLSGPGHDPRGPMID